MKATITADGTIGPSRLLGISSSDAQIGILGVFDGATVTVEFSGDGTTYAAIANSTVTEPTVLKNIPGERFWIRAVTTDAGGSTDIDFSVG